MKPTHLFWGVLVVTGLWATPTKGQPYQIVSRNISTFSSGGTYSLLGAFGQPAPLILTGSGYTLSEAFFGVAVAIQQPGAPVLKITRTSQAIVISWPAPSVGYELEVKNSLDPDLAWNPSGLPVLILGDQNTVTAPPRATPRFFRLRSL